MTAPTRINASILALRVKGQIYLNADQLILALYRAGWAELARDFEGYRDEYDELWRR